MRFAVEAGVDWIALSYVRSRQEISRRTGAVIEDVVRDAPGAYRPYLMTKIETSQAVETLDEVIQESDAVMVARGDLGLEGCGLESVPLIQKLIISKGNRVGLPVVTATQMFESMIKETRPTRAEVTDVHNAILEGTSAVMLSGETAIGKYPVEAVRHMRNIIEYLANESQFPKLLHQNFYRFYTIADSRFIFTQTVSVEETSSLWYPQSMRLKWRVNVVQTLMVWSAIYN